MHLIELKNVRAFRGQTLAIEGINLSLPLGESHAILGPNGAGKSTFIKLIARELYHVDSPNSYLKILGQTQLNIWQLREKIGFVSNDTQNNYQSLATGLEVVISAFFGSVGLHPHQKISEPMRERANDTLAELDISELADKRYLQLSTGQQRRLLLARAMVHKPQALLLDEPCSGLDLKARFWFLKKIRELCQTGTTVVLVTHEPSEIVPEIKKMTMLKAGKVFLSGEKQELMTEEKLGQLYEEALFVSEKQGFYSVSPRQM